MRKEGIYGVKKAGGMVPLILSVLLCMVFFSVSIAGNLHVFSSDSVFTPAQSENTGASPLKDAVASFSFPDTVPLIEDTSSVGESLPVSADPSQAVGKISRQFLSPYSAGLKYNNVYIKNSTGLNIDLKAELDAGPVLRINKKSEPEVLIVHTHATECYMSETRDFYTSGDKTRSSDDSENVVAVGQKMADILSAGGISVIHDTTHHDSPSYNESYSRAAKTINEYLRQYPSIKIVIDVHRDSVALSGNDKVAPTVTVDGKSAAQVMLIAGSQTGTVTDFANWRENFRLAIRWHQMMEVMYPGLPRTMLFASRRYNMNLTTGSMILEVGTEANSFEEACYSAELAANSLLCLLNTLKE